MWCKLTTLTMSLAAKGDLHTFRENRDAYNDGLISLNLGAEYIGVHDLEGRKPLLQIW